MVPTRGAPSGAREATANVVPAAVVPPGNSPSSRSTPRTQRGLAQLLRAERDDVIDALVDRAASGADSLHLRRSAEAAAATVCLQRRGMARRASLFIVAIVLAFDDNLPATHVDPLLRDVLQSPLTRSQIEAAARRLSGGDAVFLRDLFDLQTLARLPLSAIHRATVAMNNGEFALAQQCLGSNIESPARRSAAFARFLVGQRIGLDGGKGPGEQVLGSVAARIVEVMRARMKVQSQANVRIDANFFDGLFAGMGSYQDARICQIISQVAQRPTGDGTPWASVEAFGSPSSHGVVLSLYLNRGSGSIGRWRISGRPGAPIDEAVQRVLGVLRLAGVEAIEEVRGGADAGDAGVGGSQLKRSTAFATAI